MLTQLLARHLSKTTKQQRFFEENGYLILPKLFPPQEVAALNQHLDHLWQTRAQQGDTAIDIYFDQPEEARIHFRRAPEPARQAPYKILDLHLNPGPVQQACTAPALIATLRTLLAANPLVCNSLFFEWGSQQYPHFDTFFMPSKTPNKMAAAWLALDQVTKTNGPLYYYPKSHLIDPFVFSHGKTTAVFAELKTTAADHIERIIEQHGLEKQFFLPEPGDVLIWHAQLLHGGSPILNPNERRRSLVTHYWTDLDYPDPAQRIDLGQNRWLLRRPPQYVTDEETLAEVDAFLATIHPTDDQRAATPESFDPRRYLARNQDVLRARESPWAHYMNHGRAEGRVW